MNTHTKSKKQLRIVLLACGIVALVDFVHAYNRHSFGEAIAVALIWLVFAPFLAVWRNRGERRVDS